MELTQEYLKECLDYNPDTGTFIWKQRPLHHFKCIKSQNRNNRIFSEVVAGNACERGYLRITINGKRYMAHHLAWMLAYGGFPANQIDHIDGDPSNNKISNLRDVKATENQRNKRVPINNTSGCIGVSWDKSRSKWMAKIKIDSGSKTIGRFKDKFEAICARKSAEIKYCFHENHGRKVC